jgi:hypothetical protein
MSGSQALGSAVIRRRSGWRSRIPGLPGLPELPDLPEVPRLPSVPELPEARLGGLPGRGQQRRLALRRRRTLRARLERLLPGRTLPNWRWLPWYVPPVRRRDRARRVLQVLAYAGAIWLIVRPWLRRLGANQAELRRTYPGDDLFGHADVVTRAITIEARASDIWPWIVQMGYGRGGWYSLDLLDNLGRPSAPRILPEHQRELQIGDEIPSGPRSAFRVHDVEPERFLVLTYDGRLGGASWLFWLEPIDDNSTRLVERIRGHASANPLVQFTQLLGDASDVVMMLTHLYNLKRRSERSARERVAREVAAGGTPPEVGGASGVGPSSGAPGAGGAPDAGAPASA